MVKPKHDEEGWNILPPFSKISNLCVSGSEHAILQEIHTLE
jgi:hypothetical protein